MYKVLSASVLQNWRARQVDTENHISLEQKPMSRNLCENQCQAKKGILMCKWQIAGGSAWTSLRVRISRAAQFKAGYAHTFVSLSPGALPGSHSEDWRHIPFWTISKHILFFFTRPGLWLQFSDGTQKSCWFSVQFLVMAEWQFPSSLYAGLETRSPEQDMFLLLLGKYLEMKLLNEDF